MTKKAQKTPVKKTQIVEITIKRTFEVPEGTEILKNKKHGIHIVNKKQLLDAYPDLDLFQLDELEAWLAAVFADVLAEAASTNNSYKAELAFVVSGCVPEATTRHS